MKPLLVPLLGTNTVMDTIQVPLENDAAAPKKNVLRCIFSQLRKICYNFTGHLSPQQRLIWNIVCASWCKLLSRPQSPRQEILTRPESPTWLSHHSALDALAAVAVILYLALDSFWLFVHGDAVCLGDLRRVFGVGGVTLGGIGTTPVVLRLYFKVFRNLILLAALDRIGRAGEGRARHSGLRARQSSAGGAGGGGGPVLCRGHGGHADDLGPGQDAGRQVQALAAPRVQARGKPPLL
mmetsp:Transcript_15862/g.23329  ORF Transcript_15862/g.23329 Transcript_15862/m.23329 type:complete len:238 (-) Transcript_15862:763-1476(-)